MLDGDCGDFLDRRILDIHRGSIPPDWYMLPGEEVSLGPEDEEEDGGYGDGEGDVYDDGYDDGGEGGYGDDDDDGGEDAAFGPEEDGDNDDEEVVDDNGYNPFGIVDTESVVLEG